MNIPKPSKTLLEVLQSIVELDSISQIGDEIKGTARFVGRIGRGIGKGVATGTSKSYRGGKGAYAKYKDKKAEKFARDVEMGYKQEPGRQVYAHFIPEPSSVLVEAFHENVSSQTELSKRIVGYLSEVYNIFGYIMSKSRSKPLKPKGKKIVSDIIYAGILNYRDASSVPKMVSRIKQMELQEGSLHNIQQKMIFAATLLSASVAFFSQFKAIRKKLALIKREAKADKDFEILFDHIIVPRLQDIFNDILDKKIKSEQALKREFLGIIEDISQTHPDIGGDLYSWSNKVWA
jgi:hypothetical protein